MIMKYLAVVVAHLGLTIAESPEENTVTIYFIRHAESQWNEKKAKIKTGVVKKSGFGTGMFDNNVADAPLTEKGKKQVEELRDWWSFERPNTCSHTALTCLMKVLNQPMTASETNNDGAAEHDTSATPECISNGLESISENSKDPRLLTKDDVVFGTSNLMRAIETLLIFMRDMSEGAHRDNLASENVPQVHIVSALQEKSLFGTDAKTTLKAGEIPFDGTIRDGEEKGYAAALEGYQQHHRVALFNGTANLGEQNGVFTSDRFPKFCEWIFSRQIEDGKNIFVISGHSSWLMKFFVKAFGGNGFGKDDTLDGRLNLAENILRMDGNPKEGELQLKLANASMIKFQLRKTGCEVVPQSTQLIFGKWQTAGSCKKSPEACGKLKNLVETKADRESVTGTCPDSQEGSGSD
jgi:hypothetical protein